MGLFGEFLVPAEDVSGAGDLETHEKVDLLDHLCVEEGPKVSEPVQSLRFLVVTQESTSDSITGSTSSNGMPGVYSKPASVISHRDTSPCLNNFCFFDSKAFFFWE